ncbi:MarR family transcriptional regulator [Myxococcota bacterium]|nr:MarR family transcriptional regulator [Myxococcota bacterium]MBU1381575.1 MarR family transcriptional regulator [Myxococcota bacterium]MBU1498861.1 MarR family transcriptional regulator [Myxococcota bacterium]
MSNYLNCMFTYDAVAQISRIREKANEYIQELLKKEGIDDLAPSHGDILMALYDSEAPLSIKEISERIKRTSATVVVLIEKLEKAGWVERTKSEKDQRVTFVSLTKRAQGIYEIFRNISERLNNVVYEGFSDVEKVLLGELLRRVNSNFDKALL